MFAHKKTVVFAALVAIVAGVLFFRGSQRDDQGRVDFLQKKFASQIKYELLDGNGRAVTFNEGVLRFIYPPHNPQIFFTLVSGSEKKLKMPSNYAFSFFEGEFYIEYPYLFLKVSETTELPFDNQTMVYNLTTDTYKLMDVKTCRGVYISSVAYETDTLYWKQSKMWSSCEGSFKKRIHIDI